MGHERDEDLLRNLGGPLVNSLWELDRGTDNQIISFINILTFITSTGKPDVHLRRNVKVNLSCRSRTQFLSYKNTIKTTKVITVFYKGDINNPIILNNLPHLTEYGIGYLSED